MQILLGRSRWRRKRALPVEALSGVDMWGRPTFLYVTDTQRKRRVVEQEFIGRRGKLCFSPRICVLNELFDELHGRHGVGLALLSPRVEALIAWRMLGESDGRWPWLQSLGGGPNVAKALADLLRTMREARARDLGDVPHADELNDALRALDTLLTKVPGHMSQAQALEHLLAQLTAPPIALVQWLRNTHSVVLDDILQPSPLRRQVLLALCSAWSEAGAHVVLSFETGRDLGGEEAGLFFEYDDLHDVAYAMRPFAVTRGLRRAAFDRFVAQGGSSIYLALRDRVVQVGPGVLADASGVPDISDYIYGPRPVPAQTAGQVRDMLRDTVQVRRHSDRAAEVRGIARGVKAQILGGAEASSCVVAFADLLGYAPLVRTIFEDHGLPFELSAGARLAWSPVARTVLHIATVAGNEWPIDQVLALLCSDLIATDPAVDLHDLRRWCRAAGVRQGLPSSWWPALQRFMRQAKFADDDKVACERWLTYLDELLSPLEALNRANTAEGWRAALMEQIGALGLPELAGSTLHGDLSDQITSENLHAWGAVVRALDEMARDLQAACSTQWQADHLGELLSATFNDTRWHPTRPAHDAVQVIDVSEIRGITPRYTWLGGLRQGAFPRPSGATFLVPTALARRMEPTDAGAEARYLFCSVLRNALDDKHMELLELSWPATVDGRPAHPAPALADLLALPTCVPSAGGGACQTVGDVIVQDAAVDESQAWGRTDALRLASRQPAWAQALKEPEQHVLHSQQTQALARAQPEPGEHEGVLPVPPSGVRRQIGVTTFERYLKCPAKYWYKHILGLSSHDAWSPEVQSNLRGDTLHRILELFVRPRLGMSIKGDRGALARQLHRVAVEELDALGQGGGAAAPLVDVVRDDWLAGLVDDRPTGVLGAWLDDELQNSFRWTPYEVETEYELPLGPVTLTAQLDRVDQTNRRGLLVVDYKSGQAPRSAHVLRGLVLQPVAYAAIAARENPGWGVATAFVELRSPESVKRKGWIGEPDVLASINQKRSVVQMPPEDRQELLDHASDAAGKLLRGTFHTTLAERTEAGCKRCEVRRICRWTSVRANELLRSDADLYRPIAFDEQEPA